MKIETTTTWTENNAPSGALTNIVITITIDACTLEQLNHVLKAAGELRAMSENK